MFIQHGFQYLGHLQNETPIFFFVNGSCSLSLHFYKKKKKSASSGNHRRLNGKTPCLISPCLILALIRSKCCLDTSQWYYIILSQLSQQLQTMLVIENDF